MAHTDLTSNDTPLQQLKEAFLECRWFLILTAVFCLPSFQLLLPMLEVASSGDLVAYLEHSIGAWWETSLFIAKQAVVIAPLVGVYVFARHGRRKVLGAVGQVVFAAAASLMFLFVLRTAFLTALISATEAGM